MIKAYSNARERCNLHPHRAAEAKCDRCKTGLCSECVRTYDGMTLCSHCVDELEYAVASKPTLRDKLRDTMVNFRNGAIVVAVIVLIGIGLIYAFRGLLSQPITPEEFARFRYAAAGSFQTPEGINQNSTVLGAKVVLFTSDRPGFEVKHTINEYIGEEYPGWRSATATFPQDIVVQHDQPSAISKVILTQQGNEPLETWVKDFEVDVSNDGPDRGFTTVGTWRLAQIKGSQRFTFPSTSSKWIRLRVLSNYGSPDYTSLSEFDAYSVPPSPNATPSDSPPG